MGRLCRISKSDRFTIREAVCITCFALKTYVRELDELNRLAYKESVEKASTRRLGLNHAPEAHFHGFTFCFSSMRWLGPGYDGSLRIRYRERVSFEHTKLAP